MSKLYLFSSTSSTGFGTIAESKKHSQSPPTSKGGTVTCVVSDTTLTHGFLMVDGMVDSDNDKCDALEQSLSQNFETAAEIYPRSLVRVSETQPLQLQLQTMLEHKNLAPLPPEMRHHRFLQALPPCLKQSFKSQVISQHWP